MTTTSIPTSAPPAPRGGPVKNSRRSKTRAAILIGVHVLFLGHLLHWWSTGETLTPVEPSESMETLETGRINAGFVFFVAAILATLILGRFFCGWACHVVAYQDLAAWLLKKVGAKPKAVRSRLLLWAPMFLAFYMFVWPQIVIAFLPIDTPTWQPHFYTSNFWETFAGPWMAMLTFVVCGFLIVYWLGAKGFCNYGCPYGAFFGVADKLAPGRIRVTDACRGCRHCTDTCTSNVLVHEEVLKYGMVVDPACMKCLDCVDVCPKDALYFGFGKMALGAKAKGAVAKLPGSPRDFLTFALIFGVSLWWMNLETWWHENEHRVPIWVLAILSGLVAAGMTWSNRRKKFDFSLGEEIAMAVVFLVSSQLVYRSLYSSVPNLLAIGLGSITAVLVVAAWRLVRHSDVTVQHHVMKASGKLTRAGAALLVVFVVWAAFTAHSAFIQHNVRAAKSEIASARKAEPEDREAYLAAAMAHLEAADGAGLFPSSFVEFQIGEVAYARQDYVTAAKRLQRAAELHPKDRPTRLMLANSLMTTGREADAIKTLVELLEDYPDVEEAHFNLGSHFYRKKLFEQAIPHLDASVRLNPRRGMNWIVLADSFAATGNRELAAGSLYAMLRIHPGDANAINALQRMGFDPNKPPNEPK